MTTRTIAMTPELYAYMVSMGSAEPDVLRRLREETSGLPGAQMQIGPDQGRLMRWLVELIGARRCLEIGNACGALSTLGIGGTSTQPSMVEALEAIERGSAT